MRKLLRVLTMTVGYAGTLLSLTNPGPDYRPALTVAAGTLSASRKKPRREQAFKRTLRKLPGFRTMKDQVPKTNREFYLPVYCFLDAMCRRSDLYFDELEAVADRLEDADIQNPIRFLPHLRTAPLRAQMEPEGLFYDLTALAKALWKGPGDGRGRSPLDSGSPKEPTMFAKSE
jgi:hypothetical protein